MPPEVKNSKWVRDAVDAFVLSAQSEDRNSSARIPPAGKPTLIRRATFELTGFLQPRRGSGRFPQGQFRAGLSQVVDRLLKSPHFGERWGRHWLDLARYADSSGSDFQCAAR